MNKWKTWSAAWIACIAMLAVSFIPSISAAFTPTPSTFLALSATCSTDHAAHDVAAQGNASTEHKSHISHCPLCAKQGDAVTLPAPAVSTLAAAGEASQPRIAYAEPAPTSFTWTLHPSRAPPAHS